MLGCRSGTKVECSPSVQCVMVQTSRQMKCSRVEESYEAQPEINLRFTLRIQLED